MSANGSNNFLNIEDANLRVRSGNVHALGITVGGINVVAAHGLQSVTNTGNLTSNTLQFTNPTTAFTATSNIEVGGHVSYTSKPKISVESNVVTEYTGPHGRVAPTLKKYPDIDFTLGKFEGTPTGASTDLIGGPYIQGGYEVSSSRSYYDSGNPLFAWQVFDQHGNNRYQSIGSTYTASDGAYVGTIQQTTVSGSAINGEWLQLKTPNKITLKRFTLALNLSGYDGRKAKSFIIAGSDDGTTWTTVSTHTDTPLSGGADGADDSYDTNSTEYYKYHRLIVTHTHVGAENGPFSLTNWGVYGCEEDPPAGDHSVDTTFTSIMNTPQTTGAQVYVDAKLTSVFTNQVTGPTPVGTSATHDNTNKYWELNGTLTSNITVEANTFLEGDQPHAVSMWFNSSNLEANVSNTCIFSVSNQEKLDSVNLDLQSNTWHNLTYAYQGEGGSRVTYLDGRKVAEDQADDTFGEYPPFAMTGYAQGGYVVSASNHVSGYEAWAIFDQYEGTSGASPNGGWWQINTERYSTSGNYDYISGSTHNLGTSTGSSTSTDNGHWVKIEMPHKLKLSYVNMKSQQYHEQGPKDFKFYGSKNNKDWELIKSFTNATPLAGRDYTINSTVGYKAIGLVVTAINGHPAGQLALSDMQLYGHRENDLVRLPDPTNVLKYPHILTKNGTGDGYTSATSAPEYGKRGYVIKASSSIGSYPPYAAFNGETHVATGTTWIGGYNSYGTGNSGVSVAGGYKTVGAMNLKTNLGTGGSATSNGEWLYIEMPHKIKVTSTKIVSNDGVAYPPDYLIIYGTNDPSSSGGWVVVDDTYASSSSGVPNNATGKTWAVSTASSPVAYKYFALVLVKVNNSASLSHALVSDWQLLGTEEGISVPIQIGGGNIDKVANFRVYDKFVGEDQALEIWDAQKDYFGRAKSSMTLHKGRLGLGVTEPSGQLELVGDERLQEYPPGPLTNYETLIPGHGVFCQSEAGRSSISYMSATEYRAYPFHYDMVSFGYSAMYMHYVLPPAGTSLLMMWHGSGDPYDGSAATSATYAASITDLNLFPGAVEVWVQKISSNPNNYQAIGYKNPKDIDYSGYFHFVVPVFNKIDALTDYWESAASTYTSTSGGSPAVSTSGSTMLASNTPYGPWVKLKLPYEICLKSYVFTGAGTKSPKEGQIWGSTDGTTWSHVHTFTGGVADVKNNKTVSGNTNYYSEYAFITTKITGMDTVLRIVEWRLFGTPGPTTLDKGSLTLGRSLDVPRISRYDVDTETPRPEKLVVDFDTTVNSSPTDISGNSNHGVFIPALEYVTHYGGAATYYEANKAFNFKGTGSNCILVAHSNGLSPPMTGDKLLSMSCWFRVDNSTTKQSIMFLGDENTAGRFVDIRVKGGHLGFGMGLDPDTNMSGIKTGNIIESNRWYHVVGVKATKGAFTSASANAMFQLYLDGVKLGTYGGRDETGLNIPSNHNFLVLGASDQNGGGSGGTMAGQISNPKLYNVALEASEVKKLYRLGRIGRSMVISDTAVGIGKVPEAQLDVRGNLAVRGVIRSESPAWSVTKNNGGSVSNQQINFNKINVNRGGCWASNYGAVRVPITGLYMIGFFGMSTGATNVGVQFRINGSSNINNSIAAGMWPYQQNTGGSKNQVSGTGIVSLNAGDRLMVWVETGNIYTGGNGNNQFWGYFIG